MKKYYFLYFMLIWNIILVYSQNYHGGIIDDLFNMNIETLYSTSMTDEDIIEVIEINEEFKITLNRPLISDLVIQRLLNLRSNEYAYHNFDQAIRDVRTSLGWSINDIIILTVENNRIIKIETYITVQAEMYDFRRAVYSNLSRYYREYPTLIMSNLGEEIFIWPYTTALIHDPEKLYIREPLINGFIKIEYKRFP